MKYFQDVFVFDPFEGPGFEHLTKSNKYIFHEGL